MPPRKATQEQYRQYVRQLSAEEAGQLDLGPDDKPITERARLKAAAKAEGVNLHISRKGNTLVFWETDEPPKTRAKASAKPPGGGDGDARRRAEVRRVLTEVWCARITPRYLTGSRREHQDIVGATAPAAVHIVRSRRGRCVHGVMRPRAHRRTEWDVATCPGSVGDELYAERRGSLVPANPHASRPVAA
jgi:hypothetical protein